MKQIDPYSSELVEDYSKLIKDFGLGGFTIRDFPKPNRLMRRGVVFAGRDLEIISKCIMEKRQFYVLSGIMPTAEKIHLGTKMVVENIRYFQEHGATTYVLVADLEAAAARGVDLEEAKRRALNFQIPAYIALGLDPKKTIFYFQSENKEVMHFAYKAAKKVTLAEFRAIYGSADPGRIMSAATQVGDILFPQFREPMPGIIPVGIDQDPHIRLTRDIVKRTREHRFFPPSSIYHKYTPSLDGSLKMSKSKPGSFIELPEDPKAVCKKLKNALTGGRESVDEQRKKGGIPENCMIYELYRQHLMEDDRELEKTYHDCKSGELLCGTDKQIACEKVTRFMNDFAANTEKAKKYKLKFVKW
ncbi:MAG: tryptophan--tRNA ligase [archaeon]